MLELGCGPGRNALYLAQNGFQVDAVDISNEAINWAIERADEKQVEINFICANLYELEIEPESYDLVYDSGCFHHIPPHRRKNYVELVQRALKPNGYLGMTCFVWGRMGSEKTDWEVYRSQSMKGGLGYTEEKLRAIFKDFALVEFRRMKKMIQPSPLFGEDFLWTGLFQKMDDSIKD